jgi:hypothetical protein
MKEQANPGAKHAAGGFGSLARATSSKWKSLDGALKLELEAMVQLNRDRYNREIEAWKNEMLRKRNDAETAVKVDSAHNNVEGVPIREIVVGDESMREMSPLDFGLRTTHHCEWHPSSAIQACPISRSYTPYSLLFQQCCCW